jgi:hypothetical protein
MGRVKRLTEDSFDGTAHILDSMNLDEEGEKKSK